jgi:hypothetical protein
MKHFLLAVTLLIGFNSYSQKKAKKIDPAVKYIYKETTLETDDYNIYIIDAIAVGKQVKFKIKIFNKTNDYLLVKPGEINYVYEGKTIFCRDKNFVIQPNEEETEVLDFRGTDMQTDKFTLELKGIYKASAGGQITKVPNFDLPPTKNEFTEGNFSCTLKKNESVTAKAFAKFDCIYTGDGIGIMSPNKCVAVMPNGTDNPNSKKNKTMILERGKKDDFTAVFPEVSGAGDLQKSTISIKWNETFRESKLLKLDLAKVEMILDNIKK